MARERRRSKRSLSGDGDKSFRICSVLGGLDVTRYVSRDARSFFAGALDDVELIREIITETALNGGVGHRLTLTELNNTLDRVGRGYDSNETIQTTVEAGLAYSDDRPDRRIDFWVGLLNLGINRGRYYNSSSEIDVASELAFVQAASLIFPWVLDRKSKPEFWYVDHQNGRSAGLKKEPFRFDSLYTAAWLGSWGEAWAYYPPLNKLSGGNPLTVSEAAGLGPDTSTKDLPFVKLNLPWNNVERDVFFTSPYPDVAQPGLAMVSCLGPIYFTGTIGNKTYNDTYIASTGLDIGLESMSYLLDALTDRLTKGSFALLVDFELNVVVVSQEVVEKLYPERTGFEDERVIYDKSGQALIEDRRNVTYLVSDTLYQGLTKLENAEWHTLQKSLSSLKPGDRDLTRLNITITGDRTAVEHYVFYEKWHYVADWALLAFAPVKEVDNAMQLQFLNGSTNGQSNQQDGIHSLSLDVREGEQVSAHSTIYNIGSLNVVISLTEHPDWLRLNQSLSNGHTLRPGESLNIDFDVVTSFMGYREGIISFRVRDDSYPDCFYDQTKGLRITVHASPSFAFYSRLFVALVLCCVGLFAYLERRRKEADSVWIVNKSELIYDDPPEVLGRGTFGLVVAAEYRGTRVAVKRVIPPNQATAGAEIFDYDDDSADEECEMPQSHAARRYPRKRSSMGMRSGSSENTALLAEMQKRYNESRRRSSMGLASGSNSKKNTSLLTKPQSYAYLHGSFIEEMRVLSKLRHPCITTFMGAMIERNEDPLLVMELMDCGSLYDLLHNTTMIFEGDTILSILRDVSQGLRFLHSANPQIFHGDLKAANVLVNNKFQAKITDFGFSIKRKEGASGTPFWMAPELLDGFGSNSAASDVYSFGIMLYEVYSRQHPYQGEDYSDVIRDICDPSINKRPPVPESMPSEVANLLYSICLAANPASRPTFVELDGFLKRLQPDNVDPGEQVGLKIMQQNMEAQSYQKLMEEVFPPHVAAALSKGQKVEPEDFECVTIFFSDIVGFTTLSSVMDPKKVSDMVHRLYDKMDALSSKYGVQKLETIGDAWVGAANLYTPCPHDHVKRVAQFSMEASRAASATLVDEDDPSLGCIEIRIGFHSGPCTAGVVGARLPKYTVFGDTINTASRMESNGKPGRIHCSDRSEELLRTQAPEIPTKCRGQIHVKGKGDMTTYWVGE